MKKISLWQSLKYDQYHEILQIQFCLMKPLCVAFLCQFYFNRCNFVMVVIGGFFSSPSLVWEVWCFKQGILQNLRKTTSVRLVVASLLAADFENSDPSSLRRDAIATFHTVPFEVDRWFFSSAELFCVIFHTCFARTVADQHLVAFFMSAGDNDLWLMCGWNIWWNHALVAQPRRQRAAHLIR